MEESFDDKIDRLFTMKGKILIFLRENRYREKPITSEDIQEKFKIAKSTASEHLSGLEELGLIERKRRGKHKDIIPSEFGDFFV